MKTCVLRRQALWSLPVLALTLALSLPAWAQDKVLVMASTTSTEQSGLFAHLLPAFKKASGIEVRVVAQGTGQALDRHQAAPVGHAARGDKRDLQHFGGARQQDEVGITVGM